MADYYTIIAKAVDGLDPNTGAARRRLYDRARVALVAEMRSARNGLDESDILAAQRSKPTPKPTSVSTRPKTRR
jgi:hypothetical protein